MIARPERVTEEELERSNQRFRFLAEASAILASSLDYETTLARVVRLAVPFLADGCTLSLLDESGEFHRLTVANVDPEIEELLVAREAATQRKGLPSPLRRILDLITQGESILVPQLTDEALGEMGLDEEQLESARRQETQSYMIVPLAARDRVLGAMIFTSSRAQSKRTYDEDDLRLAEELARRAAMALDNARLFRELRDQDDRKDRFLATLAHELRNPLAALQHALDILEMPDTDETGRRRALDVAERQVRHQTRLVEDLLDVARLNKGAVTLRRETVDAAPIVEDAAEIHRPFAEKRGQTLTVRVHGGAEVYADPARLQQIVGNLIDNAIKYSPRDTPIEVLVDKEDGAVRIEVSDEGPGIPEDLRWNVFDAFVQGERTHEMPSAGLGIGLTIVRQLVELHGGAVELRSGSDGRGTTVVVTLPGVASADRQPRRVTPRETPVPLRVLVVDDNADAADMLASLLSAWGHRARAVYDGRAAVDAAKQDDPDIALIDIGMPDMDGYETARAMRHEAGSSARLVALTGYAQPSDVAAALEAGFDRHVAKPVDAKTLRKLLVERSEPG